MGKARIATGVLLVTLVTGAMGYTIASAVLTYQDLGFGAEIDFAYIAQNYLAILDRRPEDAQLIHLIIGSFAAAGMMLSLALSMILYGCAPQGSGSFDPQDPEVVAVLDSLLTVTADAAANVDPVGVLQAMGGGDEFALLVGNVMLTGLDNVQQAFADTYDGLQSKENTIY